jgi:hypothetical protein
MIDSLKDKSVFLAGSLSPPPQSLLLPQHSLFLLHHIDFIFPYIVISIEQKATPLHTNDSIPTGHAADIYVPQIQPIVRQK